MATFGLDFSDIYARIQDYANIKNIEGSAEKAKNAVLDAVRKIAANRRWLALRRQGTITPVASQQSYDLSSLTGFNYPVRVYYISNGIEEDIRIVGEEEWSQKSDNDSDGTPGICAFLEISGAQKFYLSPLPSASFISQYSTIYIDYDKKPTEMSADADVPEIPNTNNQMAIVYYGVADLILRQGDIAGSTAYEAKALAELNKAFVSDIKFKGKSKAAKPSFGILSGVNRHRDYD